MFPENPKHGPTKEEHPVLVTRRGGMTEYIPSPREKREALVRDHFTEVVELLHRYLART
jgi:hypothetical protein